MSGSTANLPLYKPISQPDFDSSPNAGLRYDKFCDRWEGGWKSGLGKNGKGEWVNAFTSHDKDNPVFIGDRDLLEETVERRLTLLEKCGGLALSLETQGPMVSGLGRSHPVENGFAWHHLLGIPYLPGSSVKGMVRSYATCWLDGQNNVDKADLMRIFGPRDPKDGPIHVGSVIFMDALPILPVRLKAEVMTPHYNPYYAGDNEPPGDWHSPKPIPFLAVDEGQVFLFGILPRCPGDGADCSRASEWLSDALNVMGAGAKTSSGYGRFSKVDLKNRGMRRLAWISRQQQENNVTAFLRDSPKIALEKWSEIENPEIKCEVAKEMNRVYQTIGSWGKIKETKKVLEVYLKTACSSPEDTA
ncbi:MAG: type III-B CRISPR module RAMP protein Cmr6 [Methanothrix sp.]|nr:type III-B CRISPR module RAMP protein Cmr6 [Methanothrix sp.]